VDEHFCCTDLRDRFVCASAAYRLARAAGFSPRRASLAALCAAELASNAALHGGGGRLTLRRCPGGLVEIVCKDLGPGIPDVREALRDGWSRGALLAPDASRSEGLGSGLGAILRACDDMLIETAVGAGTTITVRLLEEPSPCPPGGPGVSKLRVRAPSSDPAASRG
jgi:serine/threonine-protein kinase RsbT